MTNLSMQIETSMTPDELREKLAPWAPWSVQIEFSNGVSTLELERYEQFTEAPLSKITHFEQHIPFESMRGGTLLDIGCNVGYNSIYIAKKYGIRPVGIDVRQSVVDTAAFLSSLAGLEGGEFFANHADSFVRPSHFDVIVHFGTLYHLQNPLRSLRSAYDSLKPGGYLALESQYYDDPADERLCYFLHGLNNDRSNFFALSTSTVLSCLALLGFEEPQEVYRHETAAGGRGNMFRVGLVARKGGTNTDLATAWPAWTSD